MPRFYCLAPIPISGQYVLPDDAAHHVRVLRLRVGDSIELFDGVGNVLAANLLLIERKQVVVDDITPLNVDRESKLSLTLAQSISSQDKMDWVIQKATELGVTEIQPLITRRCSIKLSDERSEKRQAHWEKVIISACEQCGRNTLPVLLPVKKIEHWLNEVKSSEQGKIMFLPTANQTLADLSLVEQGATLLVGPEGGFELDEIKLAKDAGFIDVVMGKRVLRTETAALAGIAVLQALWGDFK